MEFGSPMFLSFITRKTGASQIKLLFSKQLSDRGFTTLSDAVYCNHLRVAADMYNYKF